MHAVQILFKILQNENKKGIKCFAFQDGRSLCSWIIND